MAKRVLSTVEEHRRDRLAAKLVTKQRQIEQGEQLQDARRAERTGIMCALKDLGLTGRQISEITKAPDDIEGLTIPAVDVATLKERKRREAENGASVGVG